MQHEALSERIGALVTGIDLSAPFEDDDVAALHQVMREHQLLLFRAAELAVEDQIRLVGLFSSPWDEKGDGTGHIFVSNAKEGAVLGRADGLMFHSDCLYMVAPLSVLSLYAMQVPASPSPTVFASGVAVAQDLPPDLLSRIGDARAVYVGGLGGYERLRDDSARGSMRVEHPVRFPSALAGGPTVLVDELFFDRFIGWDLAESDATREEIHRHLFADRNTYVHDWRVGDLVIWDNIAVQHGRKPVPDDGPRTLRRVVGLDPSVTDYLHLTDRGLAIEATRGR